jgi:pimeloyl-ACP methyl ester carboxylesterase
VIETAPVERFIERWATVALFVDDPPWVRFAAAEDERRLAPALIARALRGLGQAAAPALWDRLHELSMPVVVLVGGRDRRYLALGARIAALSGGRLELVAGAGHRVALEAPETVVQAIKG